MTDRATLHHVEAELNYMAPMAQRPRYLAYDPEPGEERSNMTYDPHQMSIYDMRPIQHELDLDRDGFGLCRAPHRDQGFLGRRRGSAGSTTRRRRHSSRSTTGASRVFIFDHLQRPPRRRIARLLAQRSASAGDPCPCRPHRTLGAAARSRLLPDEAMRAASRARVQVINLWRPIKGPLDGCAAGAVRRPHG